MSITIYHNPKCSTSRNVLQMIRDAGQEPEIVEYLKSPPSAKKIKELLKAIGISARDLLRKKEALYGELGLADPKWSEGELIGFMVEHPILIERPVVVGPKGARLCRPKERVLEVL